jgi:hypothetical protein
MVRGEGGRGEDGSEWDCDKRAGGRYVLAVFGPSGDG